MTKKQKLKNLYWQARMPPFRLPAPVNFTAFTSLLVIPDRANQEYIGFDIDIIRMWRLAGLISSLKSIKYIEKEELGYKRNKKGGVKLDELNRGVR